MPHRLYSRIPTLPLYWLPGPCLKKARQDKLQRNRDGTNGNTPIEKLLIKYRTRRFFRILQLPVITKSKQDHLQAYCWYSSRYSTAEYSCIPLPGFTFPVPQDASTADLPHLRLQSRQVGTELVEPRNVTQACSEVAPLSVICSFPFNTVLRPSNRTGEPETQTFLQSTLSNRTCSGQ